MSLFGPLLLIGYILIALLLPIYSANVFMRLRGLPILDRVGMAFLALLSGCLGFVMAIFIVAHTRKPGHDPIDMWGVAAAVSFGFLLGVPLGTWAGAWTTALLKVRFSRHG
ncbi:MAG TPA: hypothetical protein VFA07_01435 [Chthonomonadaceae bacterium]|nr:hypothetical protein [Chthonomonadaceae bacterium]